MNRKLTIDELEKLLSRDDEQAIQILPNGEIVASEPNESGDTPKPLTLRENLGGEYGA
jgi:hypothetical protein